MDDEAEPGLGLQWKELLMSLQIDPAPSPDDIARVLAQCYRLAAQRGREIREAREPATDTATGAATPGSVVEQGLTSSQNAQG